MRKIPRERCGECFNFVQYCTCFVEKRQMDLIEEYIDDNFGEAETEYSRPNLRIVK